MPRTNSTFSFGGVFERLAGGATEDQIASHLLEIVHERMDLHSVS